MSTTVARVWRVLLLLQVVVVGALAVSASRLSAQTSPIIFVRHERWTIDSGPGASAQYRDGIMLGVGGVAPSSFWRLGVGWVGQGSTAPGWTTVLLEDGPQLTAGRTAGFGAVVSTGAFGMAVNKRHRTIATCKAQPGCVFDAPAFDQGWGWIVGGGLTGFFGLAFGLDATAQYDWSRILLGANHGQALSSWSLGIRYRFR